MYPIQIPGTTFADKLNASYLQSLKPEVFYGLYANSGEFGIPMTGVPLPASDRDSILKRMAIAEQLTAAGFKVTYADIFVLGWYGFMQGMKAQGYDKFSYMGEAPEDWITSPPGQSLPNMLPYDPTTHTGVVSFALLSPYVGPVTPPVQYVGQRANNDNGGTYNAINGAEKIFAVGDDLVENGIQYVFLGAMGNNPPIYYWQYIGRA